FSLTYKTTLSLFSVFFLPTFFPSCAASLLLPSIFFLPKLAPDLSHGQASPRCYLPTQPSRLARPRAPPATDSASPEHLILVGRPRASSPPSATSRPSPSAPEPPPPVTASPGSWPLRPSASPSAARPRLPFPVPPAAAARVALAPRAASPCRLAARAPALLPRSTSPCSWPRRPQPLRLPVARLHRASPSTSPGAALSLASFAAQRHLLRPPLLLSPSPPGPSPPARRPKTSRPVPLFFFFFFFSVFLKLLMLPPLRVCFAVPLPKTLPCAAKTDKPRSRSHERLRPQRLNDYFAYDGYIVYDYLDYVDYFVYIATPHVSKL
ncbi:hypothetical protein BRADI_2g10136v3, partial [Brachypodium distachyon]